MWVERAGAVAGYEGRRVVVTGGASFIGSHLCELLGRSGAVVSAVDDLSSGDAAFLADAEVELVEADLRRDGSAAELLAGADVVFHLAARHGGRAYVDTHPLDCVGNVALDHLVVAAAAAVGVDSLVFTSSACVYPVDPPGAAPVAAPLREPDAGFARPGQAFADGEYGWAKLYTELQIAALAKEAPRISSAVCRLFNVYGPRENETHAMVALADRVVDRCDPFEVWGDGTQLRSFTHVHDVVRGLALAGAADGHRTYNVGARHATSIDELCELMFRIEGWRPERIVHRPGAPVGAQHRVADASAIERDLGWRPEVSLEVGVGAVLEERRHRRGGG